MNNDGFLRSSLRILGVTVAYLALFIPAYGLLIPAPPADASSSDAAALALPAVAALDTAVISWLILRARWRSWGLIGPLILVFYCVQTVLPQVETIIFRSVPAFAGHVPADLAPRLLVAGLIHAALWIPFAVVILGRHKSGAASDLSVRRTPTTLTELSWKLLLACLAYVVVYFTFGYYIAWRDPAVTSYYGGTDPGSFWRQLQSVMRDTPWLPLAQAVRGVLWGVLAITVTRMIRGSVVEKALAVGTLFAVVMNAGLLLPNPYMPYAVRMVHLVETASSNFLFGALAGWLFAERHSLPSGSVRSRGIATP